MVQYKLERRKKMLTVFCSKHPGYKPTKAPEDCDTCELLYVLVCRDNKYYKGASDFDTYYSKLGVEGFKKACVGLEMSVFGSI